MELERAIISDAVLGKLSTRNCDHRARDGQVQS